MQEISAQTGGGFGGQNSLNVEFGLGNATIIDSVVFEWSLGNEDIIVNVPVDTFIVFKWKIKKIKFKQIPYSIRIVPL